MTGSVLSPAAAQASAPGWRYLRGALHLHVDLESFPTALDFVGQVGKLALPYSDPPHIDLRGSRVHLTLTTPSLGGVSERDVLLANEVSALLVYLGHVPDNGRLAAVEITIDAHDGAAIAPFWRAVLGLASDDGATLADPDRLLPGVAIREGSEPGESPGRVRLEITLPHDEAPRRVAAALAAGGRTVADEAPASWVLADLEGNEVRVRTWQDRG
ncbi:MAG: VOC family protein [Actinomycetota bacterium]